MLNMQKFSLLAAGASGAVYAVCSLFAALFPAASTTLMGWLFHLENAQAVFGVQRVTATGFSGGLVEAAVYMYAVSLIFVWIFNKSAK